jgi:hypothetical protein
MDREAIGGAVRRLSALVSRRRLGLVAAGLATAGAPVAAAGRRKRCSRQRLDDCTADKQCCGRNTRCATSHSEGSNTCCGGQGATCSSDLTCCVPLMCEGGRCVLES